MFDFAPRSRELLTPSPDAGRGADAGREGGVGMFNCSWKL